MDNPERAVKHMICTICRLPIENGSCQGRIMDTEVWFCWDCMEELADLVDAVREAIHDIPDGPCLN